jgi:hypothetical protein
MLPEPSGNMCPQGRQLGPAPIVGVYPDNALCVVGLWPMEVPLLEP